MDEVVATVQHRGKDERGRAIGHHGYLKRRTPEQVKKFGSRPFASWAIKVIDGKEEGGPERFKTYDTETEAVAHAEYAANQVD